MNRKHAFFSIAQAFLLAATGRDVNSMSIKDQANIQANLLDGDEYLRKEITASAGTINLIDSNTTRTVGLSSFDKTKLPAGTLMALEGILLGVAEIADSVTTGPASQTYSTKYTDCPVPLRGAHFIIRQGGSTIVEVPVERLMNRGSVESNVGDEAYKLDALRLLQPETELEIQIRFPDAAAAVTWTASKKVFIELHLLGPKVQK